MVTSRWCVAYALAVLLAGCGGGGKQPNLATLPSGAPGSTAAVDSAWKLAHDQFRQAKWPDVQLTLERMNLELKPGDPRLPELRFMLGEAQLGQGNALQAVREFRRVSDDTPSDSLAPKALVRAADAYATLWRRPELDPTYGRSALATYQEVLNRFPGTPAATLATVRALELQNQFAYKEYKAGMYYARLKAYDSAILYFRDVVATYPRSSSAPLALLQLVKAYRTLGYVEDVQETCGYIRRFHAGVAGVVEACPPLAVDTTGSG